MTVEPQPAVVIPGIIVDFLERATGALAGTRDADLVPHVHRVGGWRVSDDRRSMTCVMAEQLTRHLRSDLEDNGRVTVTIEEIGPHETYQFKGLCLEIRAPDEEERHAFERTRDRFAKVVALLFGIDEEGCRSHLAQPTVAVRFAVEEIYVQTPGPGAGRRLMPPEETRS